MLEAFKGKDREIIKVLRESDRLFLYSEAGTYRLEVKDTKIVRVTYTQKEAFSSKKKPGVVLDGVCSDWDYEETLEGIWLCTGEIKLFINKKTASIKYFNQKGNLLLKERDLESKELEEFQVFEPVENSIQVEKVVTADGIKNVVRQAERISAGSLYHTRLYLQWQDEEALYGLGQQEEGNLNLRGKTIYVHQANRKIAMPILVSNLGYGLLVDTYSPLIFRDTEYGSHIYTEADEEMDYYFIYGGSMDGVIDGYRQLTGKASMLPKWAFGYIQSQERYETQQEILEVAKGYRNRGIGLDCIVLDWMSWEDNQWGQKSFDLKRFPDPGKMIQKLHEQNIHFMISIWPNMDETTENYKEFKERGWLLPGTTNYDALNEGARRLYWQQVERGLHCHGVDAWWCDNSEPFTPDWNHMVMQEPEKLFAEYCEMTCNHMPADQGNVYAFYHAQAIYDGQRGLECNSKRVVNLTRSAYTGQQRFGTILWSGDIAADWSTLKKQIAEGLSICASGLPYWTVDIGAFFVKEGAQWYWKGNYDQTTADLGYRELFVRWYQWACFLPIFRGHGTDCRRELWNFGDEGTLFYDALLKANRLRYRLMPYIYSMAGKVWLNNASMIRALVFDYPTEKEVWDLKDQYLFGECLMVCPVTIPMYYEANSIELKDAPKTRKVYLPCGNGWYDFYTNQFYSGGQWIEVEASLDQIPVFVKEGSILPLAQPGMYASEQEDNIELKVYTGKDAQYVLYEDAGDGYTYEMGEYQTIQISWDESNHKLQIMDEEQIQGKNITVTIV